MSRKLHQLYSRSRKHIRGPWPSRSWNLTIPSQPIMSSNREYWEKTLKIHDLRFFTIQKEEWIHFFGQKIHLEQAKKLQMTIVLDLDPWIHGYLTGSRCRFMFWIGIHGSRSYDISIEFLTQFEGIFWKSVKGFQRWNLQENGFYTKNVPYFDGL